jgi:hypothetical protein
MHGAARRRFLPRGRHLAADVAGKAGEVGVGFEIEHVDDHDFAELHRLRVRDG